MYSTESVLCPRRTLKCSWQKLGVELKTLAALHSDKVNTVHTHTHSDPIPLSTYFSQADSFAGDVRQPLLEVLPQMEEEKRKVSHFNKHLNCRYLKYFFS